MPTYKLTYFDSRGRAEVARIIMAYGDIEYEDVRLEKEQWLELKPNTPYGSLPVLEVDGEMICQSNAICRFLAKKAGLMGKTDMDEARIDMVSGCLEDYLKPLPAIYHETDEERKAVLRKKIQEDLPAGTAKLEKLLKGDHFVGDQITLADINAVYALTIPLLMGFELTLDSYPKLNALSNKVFTEPKIAAWIEKRPKTKM